jgi:TonB family protein
MAETTPTAWDSVNASAGHLSVHVEGAHPVDVPFLFERQQKRMGSAFFAALLYHIAMIVLTIFAVRYGSHSTSAAVLPELPPNKNIVWLSEPGPGGGGGGGGNKMKEPPRQAELPGKDAITVPVAKAPTPVFEPPPPQQEVKVEPSPVEQLNIPAKNMASAFEAVPGAIDGPPGPKISNNPSQGSGSGGGAGTGSGLGPGTGGGTGGGTYRPGNGVTLPRVLREVKPQYTSDAMRAKVQGTVLLECVVRPDGSVSDVQVVRSLDSTFGLDQEAIKAAKQWRFAPGTRLGEPVSVLVTIELTFTLR